MGLSIRQLLRRKGTPYDELGLDDSKWTDDELVDLMLRHPILINRPIVVTPKGVRLWRPSEVVLEILPNPDIGPFRKEDGEVVAGQEHRLRQVRVFPPTRHRRQMRPPRTGQPHPSMKPRAAPRTAGQSDALSFDRDRFSPAYRTSARKR